MSVTAVAERGAGTSLVARFADRFGVDPNKLLTTLKSTAFRQGPGDPEPSTEEMMGLLIVADQYRLNPLTKELYAFFDKRRGIVPVVSVDGWARIINEHPDMDGLEFRYPEPRQDGKFDYIECVIYRKNRAHPTAIREYFAEVQRDTGPWKSHPRRLHRHKALIQCARIAFGFAGIYDEDEAERLIEARIADSKPVGPGAAGLKAAIRQSVTLDAEPTTEPQEPPATTPLPTTPEAPKDAQAPADSGQPDFSADKAAKLVLITHAKSIAGLAKAMEEVRDWAESVGETKWFADVVMPARDVRRQELKAAEGER